MLGDEEEDFVDARGDALRGLEEVQDGGVGGADAEDENVRRVVELDVVLPEVRGEGEGFFGARFGEVGVFEILVVLGRSANGFVNGAGKLTSTSVRCLGTFTSMTEKP